MPPRADILKDKEIGACTAKGFKNVVFWGGFKEWVGTVFFGVRQKEYSLGPFNFHFVGRNHPMFPIQFHRGTAEEAESGTPFLQEAAHMERISNTCRCTSHLKLSLPPYLKQRWESRP